MKKDFYKMFVNGLLTVFNGCLFILFTFVAFEF